MKKSTKRFFAAVQFLITGLIVTPGLVQIVNDIPVITFADADSNTVSFEKTTVEASNANLVYVNLVVTGTANETVSVTYQTSSGTAIEGVDFVATSNRVSLKIGSDGRVTHTIAIKCLNDNTTREKLRVYNGNTNYGRYFNLRITGVSGGKLGSNTLCKCYLTYDHKVNATVGKTGSNGEVAYLDDYSTLLSKYHKGKGNLDGKDTWKTWSNGGVSFNNDTTRKWVNTYINTGFASAYGSFLSSSIDDRYIHSNDDIHVLAGNKQLIDNYSRSKNCPGLYLYFTVDPDKKGGYRLDTNAMYYISQNKNPTKKEDRLVNCSNIYYVGNYKKIIWIQNGDAWYANSGSQVENTFYKIEPYNGILDQGIAFYNSNSEFDREIDNIWMFMTLVDDAKPTITNQYIDYDSYSGNLRIYIRFSEPVYSSKKKDIQVKIGGSANSYYATYKEGNYSDTLVYEMPASTFRGTNITSITCQVPDDDIGDMSYHMDKYKNINNNRMDNTSTDRVVEILGNSLNLSQPVLSIDNESSIKPQNIYNLIVSANDSGNNSFDSGTIYYTWDKNESIADATNPAVYNESHELTSEERGSFALTLAKDESKGITNGDYYLHVLVVSKYGFNDEHTFGPYRLDAEPVIATQNSPTRNELKTKIYFLEVEKKATGTQIKNVTLQAKYKDSLGGSYTKKLELFKDGHVVPQLNEYVTTDEDTEKLFYYYKSNINPDDTTIARDTSFIPSILGENSRVDVDISFIVEDYATNKTTSNSFKTTYDVRTLFKTDLTVPDAYHQDTSVNTPYPVYNIAGAPEDVGLTFTIESGDQDTRDLIDDGAVFAMTVNGGAPIVSEGDYKVTLAGLKPGFYEAVGTVSGHTGGGMDVDLVAAAAKFYLTDNLDDATANKEKVNGNLVLSNHVYQLPEAKYYYFNNSTSSVASHNYGATLNTSNMRYEGGSPDPTFSSSVEAKKYVKYMEYQDLYLEEITDTIAAFLNTSSGSTTYVKAAGEEGKFAQSGQLWIRYKRSVWTTTSEASGWAYYFYGNGKLSDGINVNGLSSNLNNAIEAVVNRIVNAGKDKYLVTESDINQKTGAPYLQEGQMHVQPETVEATKGGTNYVSNPVYNGDAKLYDNKVVADNVEYPLATNMPLTVTDSTSLYYKYVGGSDWNPIEAEDGDLVSKVLPTYGIYSIREYADAGVSEFQVYYDKKLPTVNVTLNKGTEQESTIDLDGSGDPRLPCKSLTFNLMKEEVDPYAYVAIYSYPNKVLQKVLYQNDLYGYYLSNGNFYIQIGDRSGNMTTYTVLTSEASFGLDVQENESKTGVTVRVSDREENEIYSYEVYLNEVLIDNEFANYKIYRDSGYYRVVVTDIYGNTKTESVSHSAPSPEITWYYLNDSGGYSTYDPNNPVKMVLEDDITSPRTTNVYTSTTLRMMFSTNYEDSNVKFEVLDIPTTDYSFNESSGLLSINSLSSWRLRVWYENEPENDHTYICRVDNTSPNCDATFIGNSFYPYILTDQNDKVLVTASFDSLDFDKYEINDIATLDTLEYIYQDEQGKEVLSTLTFQSGSIISGKYIVLALSDPSGIKSCTVTKNGQPVQIELDSENKLIINDYGAYEVVARDNLGNVTRFSFTNVEGPSASGTVDGEVINDNVVIYGHDDLSVVTNYQGTNVILVQYEDKSLTYSFSFDGNAVTYGVYIITEDRYIDPDGIEHVVKRATYNQAIGYAISVDDARPDTWYPIITEEKFIIYGMIDSDKHACYRVSAVDDLIHVESLFSLGNTKLPSRYIAELSKESPKLVLITNGEEATQTEGFEYIYVTEDLTILDTSVSSNIDTIEFAYSLTPEFADYTIIYEEGHFTQEFVAHENGFYQIVVKNIYNNTTVYTIYKITSFASIVTVYYLDGSYVTYYENEGTIYSNQIIELVVVSENVYFEVNGEVYSGYVKDGRTSLELTRDGEYTVIVKGENGIHEDFTFEIKSDADFEYQEEWITGFNTEALLAEQSYTNTFCTVHVGDDVVYIDMLVNDEVYVKLYDDITPSKLVDPTVLEEVIGQYGIGKYEVGFRNKYGDLVKKTVHFSDVPSLILQRIITSNPGVYENYDLDFAVERGFYSNYVLVFSTESRNYYFAINGSEYRLDEPKKIEFTNISGKGSFSYEVEYLDEYGNHVTFQAILYRDDVDIDTSSMKTITYNNNLYTKDDICITFAEGLKAIVSVNGGEAKDYFSGDTFYSDGTYHFEIRDIAGNKNIYNIIHKSVNHYTLNNSTSEEGVIHGGVVNNGTVTFVATDGSTIYQVFRNGEQIKEFSSVFSTTGHYELLIEDFMGNVSYDEFYILNNELYRFDYTTPYGYEVTEVWIVKSDGSRELISAKGKNISLTINGDYVVVVSGISTTSTYNFSVSINDDPPTATLSGAEDGGVTSRDVTINGLKSGDIVKIYKNGELISTTDITLSNTMPTITEGGKYRIVVTNVQGVTVEYNFTRKSIANTAGSIFIIVSCVLLITGVGIGLLYHTKLKTDD